MKRFVVRQMKRRSYTRQGYLLKTSLAYCVFDREWRRNKAEACDLWESTVDRYKYIESANKKEVAQFYADWLNENRTDSFGHALTLPSAIFQSGLTLY